PAVPGEAQARWREPEPGAPAAPAAPPPASGMPAPSAALEPALPGAAGPAPASRRDVFDPSLNPTAPGAPRTLGTLAESAGPPSGMSCTRIMRWPRTAFGLS